jgi:transposase
MNSCGISTSQDSERVGCYTDAIRGYESWKRYGKHHAITHSKIFVSRRRAKNHIDGIEGCWSYGKHILYYYRYVSKDHFLMYLKEIAYRFNHPSEGTEGKFFKRNLKIFFGYVSP